MIKQDRLGLLLILLCLSLRNSIKNAGWRESLLLLDLYCLLFLLLTLKNMNNTYLTDC